MQSSDTLTIASITSALIDAEAKLQPATGTVALAAHVSAPPMSMVPRAPPQCYRCGTIGHVARHCPAPMPSYAAKPADVVANVAHTMDDESRILYGHEDPNVITLF